MATKAKATNNDEGGFLPPTSKPGLFQRAQAVTLPITKFKDGESKYVLILSPIVVAPELSKDMNPENAHGPGRGNPKQPPHVCTVKDLTVSAEPGIEEHQMIAGAVLASELDRAFPDFGYIGKAFEIIKQPPADGKRYCRYEVYAIDVPNADAILAASPTYKRKADNIAAAKKAAEAIEA